MRKLLLATTALVALTGAAQAAEAPLAVTVGGFVDFRAALFHADKDIVGDAQRGGDFETVYQIDIAASGKAANGLEYGAKVGLGNNEDTRTSGALSASNTVSMKDAYVWLSGAWGKTIFGDAHSASEDLFVSAPSVGLGQMGGDYTDFVDATKTMPITPLYLADDENSTRVTYYTPKVGNANHKVQLGATYTPEYGERGQTVSLVKGSEAYRDVFGAALQYTGKLGPVAAVASVNLNTGSADHVAAATGRDFTTMGFGAQLTYAGVTFGGSYVDAGHYGATTGQDKDQDVWTLGAKYGFDKVGLAASYLQAEGYSSGLTGLGGTYVKDFSGFGFGATYTWFPGLTTAADAVFYDQKVEGSTLGSNNGHVLMLSQKMAF